MSRRGVRRDATRPPGVKPDRQVARAADDIEIGSANVFADLGLPDAELHLVKAEHALAVRSSLARHGLTQAAGARLAGLAASDMSDICRGKLAKFSLERLQAVLLALGVDIEIRLTTGEPAGSHGRRTVVSDAGHVAPTDAVRRAAR